MENRKFSYSCEHSIKILTQDSGIPHAQVMFQQVKQQSRELSEELGIKTDKDNLTFLSTMNIDYTEVFHGKKFIDMFIFMKFQKIQK